MEVHCTADSGAAERTQLENKKIPSPQQTAMFVLWYWEMKSVIKVQRQQTSGGQAIK
jgi:hypothetical protein